MTRKRRLPRRFIGYCWKCGKDVEVDFCDHCQMYVQPSPNDERDADADARARGGSDDAR